MTVTVAPFTVDVLDDDLEDLRRRLARTRWPDEGDGAGWRYGTNLAYLRELVDYWRDAFDWRAQEATISAFPHFRAEIDGLGLHFIHVRGKGPRPMPIVVTHGWPSSFYQMLALIPLLADPAAHGGDAADAFDVVVPSLPGYGFSDRPARPIRRQIPTLWTRLMVEGLGYERFAAQGGDIGGGVTNSLGREYPEHLIGIHVNDVIWPYLGPGSRELSDAERRHLAASEQWERDEGAYEAMQGTKPQTVAYGLNDSPVGLAAWIVEKFRAWSDCDPTPRAGQPDWTASSRDVERCFSKDALLTHISLYWLTNTINSSMRLYYDSRQHPSPLAAGETIAVPAGVAIFPADIDRPPREWAERGYAKLLRWTEMPRGGHFAAQEEPELLAEDMRAFFRPLRSA